MVHGFLIYPNYREEPSPQPGVVSHAPWSVQSARHRAWGWHCRAPLLGQHTDAVLQELLGLDAEQRQRLYAEGVVK